MKHAKEGRLVLSRLGTKEKKYGVPQFFLKEREIVSVLVKTPSGLLTCRVGGQDNSEAGTEPLATKTNHTNALLVLMSRTLGIIAPSHTRKDVP